MQKQLKDGLVLRSLSEGVQSDQDRLPTFYKETFADAGDDDAFMFEDWTQDLMTTHPLMSHEDIFVVVDSADDDKIVSAVLLIPQTWRYGSVELPIGRIELVATDKHYRKRGLVRQLMHAAHTRSAKLGHLVQAITGIPHYYRQFGYAMAVDLGRGSVLPLSAIKDAADDYEPTYTLREATPDDIPTLIELEKLRRRQLPTHPVRDETMWRYEIDGRRDVTPVTNAIMLVINKAGDSVGYVNILPNHIETGAILSVSQYVIGEQTSILATYDDIIRALKQLALNRSENITQITFSVDCPSPLEDMVKYTYGGSIRPYQYAWYLRVPDRVAFVERIKPVLEERLKRSAAHCYTGELGIAFYDFSLLKLKFESGNIVSITSEPHDELSWQGVDVRFPYHMWLNMVFGHRSFTELRQNTPDLSASRKGLILMDSLFPKRRSSLAAIQ